MTALAQEFAGFLHYELRRNIFSRSFLLNVSLKLHGILDFVSGWRKRWV